MWTCKCLQQCKRRFGNFSAHVYSLRHSHSCSELQSTSGQLQSSTPGLLQTVICACMMIVHFSRTEDRVATCYVMFASRCSWWGSGLLVQLPCFLIRAHRGEVSAPWRSKCTSPWSKKLWSSISLLFQASECLLHACLCRSEQKGTGKRVET